MTSDLSPVDRLSEIRARLDAASPEPWLYNSYSAIFSGPKIVTDEEYWTEERFNDGHTYDHTAGQVCPACGVRKLTHPDGTEAQVWGCERAGEALDADCLVAHVPASYGDTATGQRIADAKFIAAAPVDVGWLLEHIEQLQAELTEAHAVVSDVTEQLTGRAVMAAELAQLRAQRLAVIDLCENSTQVTWAAANGYPCSWSLSPQDVRAALGVDRD